ncbi:nucleoporin-interacting protein [Cytobacillus sp. IB215665]|uniref:nucleoporin-interacting protein n=1 Tax=Cytobacillus sp. IB215665 TaxID=3097357 RepID=UPI002A17AA3C|nr:nucleoporin-interacting protein [Cytobacillus sp. IB215665]MDX8364005.1 nucleoporin-interacting protein [Cytobacillus sp. IB215665]
MQLIYSSPFAATWDQVDFTLALTRYDLLSMQPHFPGYPYFILGGMLINTVIDNGAKALAVFNVSAMITSVIPIYLMSRQYINRQQSLLVVAVIQTTSYVGLIVTQPMSEGSAIAFLWWYIWSLFQAKNSDRFVLQLLPLLFFSIVLGIRLSYLPFGIGIILLWMYDWKRFESFGRLSRLVVFAIIFQLFWVIGLIMTEGSVSGFIKLALSFTTGHFNDWGGTQVTASESFFYRLLTLIGTNIVWNGIAAKSFLLLLVYSVLFIFCCYKLLTKKPYTRSDYWLLIIGATYFIWALFAQNIDKPRHITPLVGIILFQLLIMILKRSFHIFLVIMLTFIVFSQVVVGYQLIYEQATEQPATHQLGNYLDVKNEFVVLYTWEETRVLKYNNVSFPHKRIFTYERFLQDKLYYSDATIYVTDHVLKGFELQGANVSGFIEEVTSFSSSIMSDPSYGEITLYKWKD